MSVHPAHFLLILVFVCVFTDILGSLRSLHVDLAIHTFHDVDKYRRLCSQSIIGHLPSYASIE